MPDSASTTSEKPKAESSPFQASSSVRRWRVVRMPVGSRSLGLLPGGHGVAGAGSEGAVDAAGVEAEPLQRGLQVLAVLGQQDRLAVARLGLGFVGGFGGFGFGLGNRHDIRGLGDGSPGGGTVQRPELVAEILGIGDEAVGGNLTLALQRAKPKCGLIGGVGAKRDAIPARAQPEARGFGEKRGVGLRPVGCRGQVGKRLDLKPDRAVLGLCRLWSCDENGGKQQGKQGNGSEHGQVLNGGSGSRDISQCARGGKGETGHVSAGPFRN
jgi:hypothetical protein